jgi:integrase
VSIRKHTAKSGAVTYYVYVTDSQGKPVYVGKRATKADARGLETEERAKRMRMAPAQLDAPNTVDDAWLRVLPELSARSRDKYDEQWRNYLRPRIGKKRLSLLEKGDVKAVREAMLAETYAPTTVGFVLRVLSLFLNLCVERKWIAVNPAAKSTKGLLKPKHTADSDEAETMTDELRFIPHKEDMAKVLRAAPSGPRRDLIAFGMFTGCRIGEVCAVDWRDVQLGTSKLCVRRSVLGPTKSGKARWIPIQKQLRPVLERRWLAQGRPSRGRVFPELWHLRAPDRLARAWLNDALDAAGIGHFTTHEAFRHSFASHFVMEGGDIFRLAKYLGHGDVKITFSVYAHLRPGAFAEDEDRIVLPPFEEEDAEVIPLARG